MGTGRHVITRDLSVGSHVVILSATDSDGSTATAEVSFTVVDTGAPAPRTEGANPDAEQRLLAGSPTLPGSGSSPVLIAAITALALVVVFAAAYLVVRRRAVGRG